MIKVQLRAQRPAAWVREQLGRHARPSDFDVLVTGEARIYKPNGELLLAVLRGGLPRPVAEGAYPFLHWLKHHVTYNRGAYAADVPSGFNVDPATGRRIKADGTLANTLEHGRVHSSVVGFMDRYPRMPFCRQCALSTERPEEWGACLPMIQEVGKLLGREAPERHAAQLAEAKRTHPAYVIPGTPFTTLTVNNTVAGGYHLDAGDFDGGFGAMAVLRRGDYTGGLLVLPAFGVAVDLRDRDVILFDVHEVHGNTPIVGHGPENEPEAGGFERISVVLYFRRRMVDCLSPAEELERAKARGALDVPAEDA